MPPRVAFGIVQQNIKDFPDITAAQFQRIAGPLGAQGGWIGTNEVEGADDDAALDKALPVSEWWTWSEGENNIKVRASRWSYVPDSYGRLRLHGGRAGVSPHREVAYVTLLHNEAPLFTPTVFAVWHAVSVGPDSQSANDRAWREINRSAAYSALSGQFAAWSRAGLNIVWVGDTNDSTTPKLHPREVRLVDDTGIDKIGWIPAATSNFDLRLLSTEKVPNPVEPGHPMRVANVEAVANGRYRP